jgi:hypothetical protein
MPRVFPALLALSALIADLAGSHGTALVILFVTIPAAFALALDCYGRTVETCSGAFRIVCAAGGLGLLVLSAALRSPAVVGGVPRLAVSAIVFCLVLYLGAAAAWLFSPRPVRAPRRVTEELEQDRLAA